jgi:hypothetical protein
MVLAHLSQTKAIRAIRINHRGGSNFEAAANTIMISRHGSQTNILAFELISLEHFGHVMLSVSLHASCLIVPVSIAADFVGHAGLLPVAIIVAHTDDPTMGNSVFPLDDEAHQSPGS